METKDMKREPIKMKSSDSSKKMVATVPDKELELILNEALNNRSLIMISIVTDDIAEDGNNVLKHWWKLYSFPTSDIPIALENHRSTLIKKVLMYDGPRQPEDIEPEEPEGEENGIDK